MYFRYLVNMKQRPAYCTYDTTELLQHTTPDFIELDMWPQNLPVLNPVDYAIWSVIQQHVYETRLHDTVTASAACVA